LIALLLVVSGPVQSNGGPGHSKTTCIDADALTDAGLIEEAKSKYTKLANSKNIPECAIDGLVSIKNKENDKSILLAQTLSQFGYHTKSREIIQNLLEKENEITIPKDLQYLLSGNMPVWQEIKRYYYEFWIIPILEIAAWIFALAFLLYKLSGMFKKSLIIEEFETGIFKQKTYMGKDFSSIIRSQYYKIASGSMKGHISLVTGQIEQVKMPSEVQAAIPIGAKWLSPLTWGMAVLALLYRFMPNSINSLKGSLHRDDNYGVGITAQLVKKGKITASQTFWQTDFESSAPLTQDNELESLHQLAEYAAVWLVFKMKEKDYKLLGTNNWQSFAYFLAALYAKKQHQEEDEKKLYIKALQLDPTFFGARLNLARWFMDTEPERKDIKMAQNQLLEAKKQCEKEIKDPTVYSVMFNLAVLKYDDSKPEEAKVQINELIKRIKNTQVENKKWFKKDKLLEHHLDTILPAAKAMRFGVEVERFRIDSKTHLLNDADFKKFKENLKYMRDSTQISSVYPRFHFNLACSYSIIAEVFSQINKQEEYLNDSVKHLERCFQLDNSSNFVNYVEDDKSLSYVCNEKVNEIRGLEDKYRPPSIKTPLANVAIIGNTYAQKLLKANIHTQEELLLKTIYPAARKDLAKLLNISEKFVTEWAHAMDLLRISNLEPPHLQLLSQANIHSLTELKARNPSSLKALLDDYCKVYGDVNSPDLMIVSEWINDARINIKPMVRVFSQSLFQC